MLDRFGPPRVAPPLLLLVAALGALIFTDGERAWVLLLARVLLGMGVWVTWFAALKAIVMWFPKERLPLVNGWLLAIGTLGAVTAAGPADAVVHLIGWRGLFAVAAGLTVVVSAAIFFLVPKGEASKAFAPGRLSTAQVMREVIANRDFLRFAPLAGLAIGTAWAMQGLWEGVWLTAVDRLDHSAVVGDLFIMACALSAGGLFFGTVMDRLRWFGVTTETVFGGAMIVFMTIQLLIVAHAPVPSWLLWGSAAAFGSLTAVTYAMMSEIFPKEKIGRANSMLSLFNVGSGFLIQSGVGYVLALWRPGARRALSADCLRCGVRNAAAASRAGFRMVPVELLAGGKSSASDRPFAPQHRRPRVNHHRLRRKLRSPAAPGSERPVRKQARQQTLLRPCRGVAVSCT